MSKPIEILLVDDDEMTIFIHEKIIDRCANKHPFKSFRTGQTCLEYIEQNDHEHKKYLVLLDINMPMMSGWEVLDRIDEIKPNATILIVMATSSVDYEDKKKAENYPRVVHFFEKPLTIETCEKLLSLPQLSY